MKNRREALRILNGIATINKKPLLSEDSLEERDYEHVKKNLDKRKYTILDLFRFKSLCIPTVILIFAHFFIELFYWGTGFALPSLGTSMYLNIFLFGLIELISYIVAGKILFYYLHDSNILINSKEYCARKLKRRNSFVVLGAICTVLSFVFYFLKVPDSCTDSDQMCAVKIIKTLLVMVITQIKISHLLFFNII